MEGRYIIIKSASGIVEVEDTNKTRTIWMGIKNIEAIGMTRSQLEELQKELIRVLSKP